MEFKDLEFKTLDICRSGTRFPFVAHLTKDDFFYRCRHSRNSVFMHLDECVEQGASLIMVYNEGNYHIGTYNVGDEMLYTNARELFCQMN